MRMPVSAVEITLENDSISAPNLRQGATQWDSETRARVGTGGGTGPVGEPMARGLNLLTSRFTVTATNEGKYADGGGLYLVVRQRGQAIERLWLFRYKRGPRGREVERTVSLGSVRDVPLATAREDARACREALARGEDPKAALGKLKAKTPTFGDVADKLLESIASGFESAATHANWKRSLGDHHSSALRKIPIDEVSTKEVLEVLTPIWQSKPETARKTRERIERVLDAAKASGLRSGENPARWKGHLKLLLPAQTAKKGHHRAMQYESLPDFMARLRVLDSISALALEWTILTAARTAESIGASRSEINRETKVWTIPAKRMKERREHSVPLCDRCIEIFDELEKFSKEWLFPARDPRKHMSNMAMSECLRGLGDNATVHGFRSTFRDWAGDCTGFPREIAEAALAHAVGDEAERAYRRSDALERRRKLMVAWEGYCMGRVAGNVTAFRRAK